MKNYLEIIVRTERERFQDQFPFWYVHRPGNIFEICLFCIHFFWFWDKQDVVRIFIIRFPKDITRF